MSINESIELLKVYNGPLGLTLHNGASEELIRKVESACGITLPDDFKMLYGFTDGFEIVEDIFNMIPLAEIIDNNERQNEDGIYIAEYMIYSDMWQLEINPDNCNDYKIFIEANSNKLVLTNSLSEFIGRFLQGGVFEPGGLYEWQEETELQPIYSTKLKTAEFLLTVFNDGLSYDLISTKEIMDWADHLIMNEDEPDYFFIELSLSNNKNQLISLLNSVSVPESSHVVRAILGLLYHRLSTNAITVEKAIMVMDKLIYANLLTPLEKAHLYSITDEIWMNNARIENDELTDNVLSFLAHYQQLDIANYKNWLGLSYRIEYQFTNTENKLKIADKHISNKHQLKLDQHDAKIFAICCMLAIASFIIMIVTYNDIADKALLSKFRMDLYQFSSLYLTCFIFYYLLKGVLWLVNKLIVIK